LVSYGNLVYFKKVFSSSLNYKDHKNVLSISKLTLKNATNLTNTRNISPTLGEGVYSIPDAANILDFPIDMVRRWIKTYWENKFTSDKGTYTWGKGRDRGFNFHTLVELIAIYALREKDVSFHKIIEVRTFLREELKVEYPFASEKVMSDGDKFYFVLDKTALVDINLKRQISIKKLVEPYCEKLNFDAIDTLANQFWPLGKDRSVVVDPDHRLGEPVIKDTNISPNVLASMVAAGDSIEMVADIYRLQPHQVQDAVDYFRRSHVAA
jgi:uncharacterized protein (DUF433 family)/transposase